jgi:hypothetical protein
MVLLGLEAEEEFGTRLVFVTLSRVVLVDDV